MELDHQHHPERSGVQTWYVKVSCTHRDLLLSDYTYGIFATHCYACDTCCLNSLESILYSVHRSSDELRCRQLLKIGKAVDL